MKIPVLDLKRQMSGAMRGQIDRAIADVLDSGQFIGGPVVEAFEREFAAYCGVGQAVGTGNGLDALFLALQALSIGPGDEVIVPAQTFVASWIAVSRTGATLVPVDVRPDTGNVDERLIEQAVTAKTRAIMVVHLYGFVPDMSVISQIAARRGLAVIEDAAQAHGAVFGGRKAGSLGTVAAFSFYPTKNMGALGDAGMVTTDDDALAAKIRSLRDYGRTSRNQHDDIGINSRLDPVQASILRLKLQGLDDTVERRRRIAGRYLTALKDQDPGVLRPLIDDSEASVWHQFVVVAGRRDGFIQAMSDAGIGTDIHYPTPPYRQPCYADAFPQPDQWPISDTMAGQIVSLPIGEYLSEEEIDYICDRLAAYPAD